MTDHRKREGAPHLSNLKTRPFERNFALTKLGIGAGTQIVGHSIANLFRGEIFSSGSKVYDVPALEAGTYFFRCDVHPDMTGTITAK